MGEQRLSKKLEQIKAEAANLEPVGCFNHHGKYDPSCLNCCVVDLQQLFLLKIAQLEVAVEVLEATTRCSC